MNRYANLRNIIWYTTGGKKRNADLAITQRFCPRKKVSEKDKGDKVIYEVDILPGKKEKGMIGFRYNTPKGNTSTFQVTGLTESRFGITRHRKI